MSKPQHSTKRPQPLDTQVFTTAPVVVPDIADEPVGREFLRLPKSGTRDKKYGLSRSAWNELILPSKANDFNPPILSVCKRKPGALRGIRLIVAASAKAYFGGLIAEAEAKRDRVAAAYKVHIQQHTNRTEDAD